MAGRKESTRGSPEVIRLDATRKADFTIAEDDDDGSVVLDMESEYSAEEELYDNECGYWLVKMLRGATLGRQIKREVFKVSIYHFLWGTIIFLISVYQDLDIGRINGLLYDANHGGSVIQMQFTTALGALIMTGFSWAAMRHWASLVTNRELLGSLLILYQCFLALHFTIVLWSINALGATFKDIDWANEEEAIQKIYPSYCATIVVTAFYLPVLVYYGLNLSYYCETMLKTDGVIEEPNVDPDDVYDLSEYSLIQFLLMPLAIPIVLFFQLKDMVEDCLWVTKKWIDHRRALHEASAKKRKSLVHRIWKTGKRWYNGMKDIFKSTQATRPASMVVPTDQTLTELRSLNHQLDNDIETEEEKARKIIEEEERQEALRKENMDRIAREKQEALEAAAEKNRLEQAAQQAKLDEIERVRVERETAALLDKDRYKEMWGSMGPAGSFQCKLKVPPSKDKFAEHLEKQGFHVVFTNNTGGASECEIGICNIRGEGTPGTGSGPWFLARFVAGKNAFSAVMKCDDPSVVTTYVKKFALAKILKIDTSA